MNRINLATLSALSMTILFALTPCATRAEGINLVGDFERSPETPINQLKLALSPLTMADIEKEVAEWGALVVAKSKEITREQITQKRLAAKAEAGDEAAATEREASVEKSTKLTGERTKLVDRFTLVLEAYEARGGDRTQWDQYLDAWSGLQIDVTDASEAYTIIIGWLKDKEGGIRWGINIGKFLLTLLLFLILSRIAGRAIGKALSYSKSSSALLRDFLVSITRRTVFFIGFIFALTALEVPIGPFMAAIGAAGLVVGLALQGTLSNFASGILILVYKPFDVGDGVSVAGVSGSVKSMNLISTTIHTFDNQKVIVPNNAVWGSAITNITGNPTRRVDLVFGIGYSDDIDKAKDVLKRIVTSHELVLKDPEPVINMHELADSSVNFVVRPWSKTSDYWTVYWDITREVKKQFDAEGISIPFPQRDVHVFQEPAAT